MARPSDCSRKGAPFSIRLSGPTDRLVEAESARTRRSKSAVVEALTEEAARGRRFPGIGFRGDDARRRPWVVGSGLDVWEILQMLEDYGGLDTLVADTHLTERQVGLAVAYGAAFPDEVERAIEENRRPVEELSDLYPFIRVKASHQ